MNKPAVVKLLMAALLGMPSTGSERSRYSDFVACRCGEECGPGKGCSARANALAIGWRKIDNENFECPRCRKR